MPMDRRLAGAVVRSRPSTSTVPLSGSRCPATMLSVVVLPQPDGPSRVRKLTGFGLQVDPRDDLPAAQGLPQPGQPQSASGPAHRLESLALASAGAVTGSPAACSTGRSTPRGLG